METMTLPSVATGFIHADAQFRAGRWHEEEGMPCQDYALAAAGSSSFAIVSDGCSMSGRTDIGARVMTLAAARYLRSDPQGHDIDRLRRGVLSLVRRSSRILGLVSEDLDATLGVVQSAPGGVRAILFGDGVITARGPDGIDIVVVEWAGNMPGYPAYALDPVRAEHFIAASDAMAAREGRPACRMTRTHLDAQGNAATIDIAGLTAAAGLRGIAIEWAGTEPLPEIVAVMSDGALQMQGVDWRETISALMAIRPAREGAFVARRFARALKDFGRRDAWPGDDLAMAAIARDAG